MIIVTHELVATPLFQKITTGTKDLDIGAIRPHLYKANAPAGSLIVQVWDANQKVLAQSNSVLISNISAEDFFHGEVKFDINASLKSKTDYYIALTSTGYTYGASTYVGWCNDYDLRKVGLADNLLGDGTSSPLLMELWINKQITEGNYYG